jgi:hypothetical protein
MRRMILIAVLALAACGADGAPEPPSKSGLSVSGKAQIGMVLR